MTWKRKTSRRVQVKGRRDRDLSERTDGTEWTLPSRDFDTMRDGGTDSGQDTTTETPEKRGIGVMDRVVDRVSSTGYLLQTYLET